MFFANQMQMVLFPTLKILPKHIENCAIDVNILQIVNLTKTLLRMQRMKPTSINHVNTCSNFNSFKDDLCSSLFYGEQADARVNERHDILADCKSNQDIIGVPEDEANIIKKCVTCPSFDSCDDLSNLVCPMVDRLKPIDVYTTVCMNVATFTAMYVFAYFCYDYANYDACLAPAILGSAKSTSDCLCSLSSSPPSPSRSRRPPPQSTRRRGRRERKKRRKKPHYLPYHVFGDSSPRLNISACNCLPFSPPGLNKSVRLYLFA